MIDRRQRRVYVYCTITGTVFETGNPTRLQILTLKFGKQAIVILDEQLPRMDPQLVVPRTIKNGVALPCIVSPSFAHVLSSGEAPTDLPLQQLFE